MSEWTIDTLKEHFDRLRESDSKAVATALVSQEKAVAAAMAASEKAIEKSDSNAERWRSNANEWRGAMNDRERILMPRAEAEVRLAALEKWANLGSGRSSGLNSGWTYLIAAVGLASTIAGIIVVLMRH